MRVRLDFFSYASRMRPRPRELNSEKGDRLTKDVPVRQVGALAASPSNNGPDVIVPCPAKREGQIPSRCELFLLSAQLSVRTVEGGCVALLLQSDIHSNLAQASRMYQVKAYQFPWVSPAST
eukprot:scaffold2462_cov402-Prasinococcus_capsulatus_cf.AAC.10